MRRKKENEQIWPYSKIPEHYDNQKLSKSFKSLVRLNSNSIECFNYFMMKTHDTSQPHQTWMMFSASYLAMMAFMNGSNLFLFLFNDLISKKF